MKRRVKSYVTATVREFWDVELPDDWPEFDRADQSEYLTLAAIGNLEEMTANGRTFEVPPAAEALEDEIIDTSDRDWDLERLTQLEASQ